MFPNGEIILPESLEGIGQGAFIGTNLKTITISESVREIGKQAFYDTSDLESIVSHVEEPFAVSELCDFSKTSPKLFVPAGTRKKYMATQGWDMFKEIIEMEEAEKKCATPAIAYDKGKLVFGCETEGAECVYEIKCTDAGIGRGGEVSLSQTYEIRVHATLDGYEDSDVAVATIGWRNGRPVMEGFSSVTMDDDEGACDVNGDGIVDVADIATVIDKMAR